MPTKDYKPLAKTPHHRKDSCRCGKPKGAESSECWECRVSPLNRFTKKYDVEENTGCWIWNGSRQTYSGGYGVVGFGTAKIRAHRLAWELLRGSIPAGLHVLHKCDNPPCVNPDHLFLGSQRDNNDDKLRKGRTAKGETSGNAKLKADDVAFIRSSDLRNKDLAELFNVDPSAVSVIRNRKRWRHL